MKIVLIGIAVIGLFGIIGCSSTHRHCGTAHYSEMNSQDFQNAKENMQTNLADHYHTNARDYR